MRYDSARHHGRSVRVRGYDYTQPGAYFITVCTRDRNSLFGEVVDDQSCLNDFGRITQQEWLRTGLIRTTVQVDEFIVMPNHIHGILIVDEQGGSDCRGTVHRAPTASVRSYVLSEEQFGRPVPRSVPTIVRSFKATVTTRINALRGTPGKPVWKRGYYEHIIRSEDELGRIRQYIADNPLRWSLDRENPAAVGGTRPQAPWEV